MRSKAERSQRFCEGLKVAKVGKRTATPFPAISDGSLNAFACSLVAGKTSKSNLIQVLRSRDVAGRSC
jgi:hypothetical protein